MGGDFSFMKKPRAILAGGSGFLGKALARTLFDRGFEVITLTRTPKSARSEALRDVYWDGKTIGEWTRFIDGAEAVINLAGKNVNCRYTPENRREINESRTNSVRVLAAAIERCETPPKVWVQASSLAIYGDAGESWCDDTAPPGSGFPVETCLLWEKTFNSVTVPKTRKVLLRIGFVLGAHGGALRTLSVLAKWFLGGTIGTGRQYISWIHLADLNQMVLRAIENSDLAGVFNATSPSPVTNAEFMRELRRVLPRPWSPPVPTWMVHVGSWVMRTEACLALTGRRCMPRRFVEHGFEFRFPGLRAALSDLLGRKK